MSRRPLERLSQHSSVTSDIASNPNVVFGFMTLSIIAFGIVFALIVQLNLQASENTLKQEENSRRIRSLQQAIDNCEICPEYRVMMSDMRQKYDSFIEDIMQLKNTLNARLWNLEEDIEMQHYHNYNMTLVIREVNDTLSSKYDTLYKSLPES